MINKKDILKKIQGLDQNGNERLKNLYEAVEILSDGYFEYVFGIEWDGNPDTFDEAIESITHHKSINFKKNLGYEDHELDTSWEDAMKILAPGEKEKIAEGMVAHIFDPAKRDLEYKSKVIYEKKDGTNITVLKRQKVIEWNQYGLPWRVVGTQVILD